MRRPPGESPPSASHGDAELHREDAPGGRDSIIPGLNRHDYGKEEREGRRVGHLTFSAMDTEAIAEWQGRLPDSRADLVCAIET